MSARQCLSCGGAGTKRPTNRELVPCGRCEASGQVVTCMGCGDDMPEPEAYREGEFCGACREAMDHPEVAA